MVNIEVLALRLVWVNLLFLLLFSRHTHSALTDHRNYVKFCSCLSQRQQHLIAVSAGWMSVSVRALPEEEHDSLPLWALPFASPDTSQSAVPGWKPLLWNRSQPVSPLCAALPASIAEARQPRWAGTDAKLTTEIVGIRLLVSILFLISCGRGRACYGTCWRWRGHDPAR